MLGCHGSKGCTLAGEKASRRCYCTHLLKPFGGLLILLHYDYDPKDYNINSMPVVMVVIF